MPAVKKPTRGEIRIRMHHKRKRLFSGPSQTILASNSPAGLPVTAAMYEAADLYAKDKSWLQAYVQGAKTDLPSCERIEIIRKARWFEKNSPPMAKALDLIEGNVVGVQGINVSITAQDRLYAARLLKAWLAFAEKPEASSSDGMADFQAKVLRAVCTDGDLFVRKLIVNGRPAVRCYEAHQCVSIPSAIETVDTLTGKSLKDLGFYEWDGVVFAPDGKPAYYCLADDCGSSSSYSGSWNIRLAQPKLYPADQIIHVFEASRFGQARGLSLFASGLRPLHDLDDIQTMELRAVRSLADVAQIIKMANGEAEQTDGISLDDDDDADTSTTETSEETRKKYYQEQFGGRTIILDKDDDHKQTDVIRPSAQMQQLWVYLQDQFCKSIGLSYAALSDYNGSWGGAALRGAIVADNRFYDCRSKVIIGMMQSLFEFVGEFENRKIAAEPGMIVPQGWNAVRWHSPRRNTVDIGYSFEATRGEIAAGFNTYEQVCGERGLDWKVILRQRAEEEKYIDTLAKEMGIERNLIAALGPNERPVATQTATPEFKPIP